MVNETIYFCCKEIFLNGHSFKLIDEVKTIKFKTEMKRYTHTMTIRLFISSRLFVNRYIQCRRLFMFTYSIEWYYYSMYEHYSIHRLSSIATCEIDS